MLTYLFSNIDNVTIYFLKDIIMRRKRKLENSEVQTVHVPQYKNLTLEKIFEFIADKPLIDQYLPDPPDLAKTPKAWVVNVCAAVIGQPFR